MRILDEVVGKPKGQSNVAAAICCNPKLGHEQSHSRKKAPAANIAGSGRADASLSGRLHGRQLQQYLQTKGIRAAGVLCTAEDGAAPLPEQL